MPSGYANGDSKSGKAKDTHAIVEKWFPISPSGLGASRHSSNQKGKTMKALDLKKGGANLAVALAAVAGMSVFGIDAAMAGTDSTFDTALTQFTNFLEGSGGKIITVLSLAGGIVALASGRFSLGQVAIPVGVGVGAGTGVPIVTSTITGTV
jgi:conjugal transfer pilus assembly protein TraA